MIDNKKNTGRAAKSGSVIHPMRLSLTLDRQRMADKLNFNFQWLLPGPKRKGLTSQRGEQRF
jgi:hypothetical protein